MNQSSSFGLFCGLAAYILWGLVPLYFRAVEHVPPFEMLAHRVAWSIVVLCGLAFVLTEWQSIRAALTDRRTARLLCASTILIALNWGAFIYGVITHQVLQTSLGYFIAPLVNVALGIIFLGERMRIGQWVALSLAFLGVAVLVVSGGEFPWIALTLAFSFGTYGLIRKQAGVDGLAGLTVETMLLTPLAIGFLLWQASLGRLTFGSGSWGMDLLIAASGIVTTVPLLCFALAVVRLRLTTIGFLQYISPSVTFFLAILAFGEEFSLVRQICFGFIWAALAVFVWDIWRATRAARRRPLADPVDLGLQVATSDVNRA